MVDGKSPITVFYWLTDELEDAYKFKHFANYCTSVDIDLVRIDFDRLHSFLKMKNKVLFIHKINQLLWKTNVDDVENAWRGLSKFKQWTAANPQTIDIVDHWENTQILMNRFEMSLAIETAFSKLDKNQFFVVPFVQLVDQNKALEQLSTNGINHFPIICKPIKSNSHHISIVTCRDGLKNVPFPCIAQSFIDHNKSIFKMYILGEKLFCFETNSLPDSCQLMTSFGTTIHFNSLNIDHDFDSTTKTIPCRLKRPSDENFQLLATNLRKTLKMDMFGADVIVDSNTGRLACVDINAFPSYKVVPNFFKELSNFLKKRWQNMVPSESELPFFIN